MLPRWVHTFNAKEPVSAHSTPGPKHFATMLFINRTVALQIHLEHKFNNAYPELYDIMTRERKSSYKCTYARFASASTVGANQQISWSTRSQIAVVPIINMPFKRKYNSMRMQHNLMHHHVSDYNIMNLSGFARNVLMECANRLYTKYALVLHRIFAMRLSPRWQIDQGQQFRAYFRGVAQGPVVGSALVLMTMWYWLYKGKFETLLS